jgi:O-antigen ligase
MANLFDYLNKLDYIFFGILAVLFVNSLQEWYFATYIFPFFSYITIIFMLFSFESFGFYFYVISFFFDPMFYGLDVAPFIPINFRTAYLMIGMFILFKLFNSKRKFNFSDKLMMVWPVLLALNMVLFEVDFYPHIQVFECVIVYFIIAYFVNSKEKLEKTLWFLLLGFAFFGIRLFRDFIFAGGISQKGLYGWENNYLALIVVSGVAIAFFMSRASKDIRFLCSILAVVMGASRGALLALFVVFFVILVKGRYNFLRILQYVAVVPILFLVISSMIPQDVRDRYLTLDGLTGKFESQGETADEGSMNERIRLVWAGWAMFSDNLLFGVGFYNFRTRIPDYGDFPAGKAPHNLYIQILSELGIFGGIAFFSIVIFSIYNVYSAASAFKRKKDFKLYYICMAVFGGLAGFLTASFFLNPDRFYLLWTLFAVASACKHVALTNGSSDAVLT